MQTLQALPAHIYHTLRKLDSMGAGFCTTVVNPGETARIPVFVGVLTAAFPRRAERAGGFPGGLNIIPRGIGPPRGPPRGSPKGGTPRGGPLGSGGPAVVVYAITAAEVYATTVVVV